MVTRLSNSREIYIAYSIKDTESAQILENLLNLLMSFGLSELNYLEGLPNKASIKQFSNDLGWGEHVILILSNAFMKDPICMYQMHRLLLNDPDKFSEVVYPIILSDFDLDGSPLKYIEYWAEIVSESEDALARNDIRLVPELIESLNDQEAWARHIGKFLRIVRDMNLTKLDELEKTDYSVIIQDVREKLGDVFSLELSNGLSFEFTRCIRKHIDEENVFFGKSLITNQQYKYFLESESSGEKTFAVPWGGDLAEELMFHPVVNISHHDALAFCEWLSTKFEGFDFQLPSVDYWEIVLQRGDDNKYPWGNEFETGLANTYEEKIASTSPVGQFSPQGDSQCGCSDLIGNVWEWTSTPVGEKDEDADVRHNGRGYGALDTAYFIKGGSFMNSGYSCGCDANNWKWASSRDFITGFRVIAVAR